MKLSTNIEIKEYGIYFPKKIEVYLKNHILTYDLDSYLYKPLYIDKNGFNINDNSNIVEIDFKERYRVKPKGKIENITVMNIEYKIVSKDPLVKIILLNMMLSDNLIENKQHTWSKTISGMFEVRLNDKDLCYYVRISIDYKRGSELPKNHIIYKKLKVPKRGSLWLAFYENVPKYVLQGYVVSLVIFIKKAAFYHRDKIYYYKVIYDEDSWLIFGKIQGIIDYLETENITLNLFPCKKGYLILPSLKIYLCESFLDMDKKSIEVSQYFYDGNTELLSF